MPQTATCGHGICSQGHSSLHMVILTNEDVEDGQMSGNCILIIVILILMYSYTSIVLPWLVGIS